MTDRPAPIRNFVSGVFKSVFALFAIVSLALLAAAVWGMHEVAINAVH